MTADDRYPPEPHPLSRNPTGWYAVALSHELAPGAVVEVHAFGRELAVFRTQAGVASVLDAFCAHLGANLAQGSVDGDCLRCPFHRWGYGAAGVCTDIPYATKVPPGARVHAYPVRERNGAILAWFDAAQREPLWEIPEISTEGYCPTRWIDLTYKMHIQDIAENGVDIAHFPPIHGCDRSGIEVQDPKGMPFRFILKTSYDGDGIGVPGQFVDVTTQWEYYGLGVFHAVTTADAYGTRVRQIFHFTPIPGDRVHFRTAISVDTTTVPANLVELAQQRNGEMTKRNLDEDSPIWARKRYPLRPVLTVSDGPFGLLRKWSRAFYSASEAPISASAAPAARPVETAWDDREGMTFDLPVQAVRRAAAAAAPSPSPEAEGPATADAVRRIFADKLPRDFRATAVPRAFVVQYLIEGEAGGTWHMFVDPEHCRPCEGGHPQPDVTVSIAADNWLRLHTGRLDGAQAFLGGLLKIAGDFDLAIKLGEVFPLAAPEHRA